VKKILIAAVAAAAWLGTSGAASAQMFNWTGFYVGANAGWISSDFKGTFPNLVAGSEFTTGRSNQGVAGFYGGYQFQNGNWVIGAEAGFDVPLSSKFASRVGTGSSICAYTPPAACEARLDSLFRIGGRLGWAFDRWLVYGTGGYARGLIEAQDNVVITILDQASGHSAGWYAGGGIDFAVFKNLFLGVEYKHYDLGSARLGNNVTTNVRNVTTTADSVVGRMTLKFGP
jgi:outer membrane immunogenic protein